ncbi:MAG: type-F conjugative transfer system pilin assembly protein TrbC [Rickettsiales bacterium]|nr:MAG: type-F conjugative transfer system pilin assembly protein TrbC [Rickettsiales bacterium]
MEEEKLLFYVENRIVKKSLVLLLLTLVSVMSSTSSFAKEEEAEVSMETKEWAKGLTEETRRMSGETKKWVSELTTLTRDISMDAIKAKWQELQVMRMAKGEIDDTEIDIDNIDSSLTENIGLRVFISSSMSPSLLRQYGQQAKKYGAVLVLRGLPTGASGRGSWRKLSELVMTISGTSPGGTSAGDASIPDASAEGIGIQLDPASFEKYNITSVPSMVLAREEWSLDDGQEKETGEFDKVIGNIGLRAALELFAEDGDLADEARSFLEEAG